MKLPLPVVTWFHKRRIEWSLAAAAFEPPQLITDRFDDKTGKPEEAVTFPIDDMSWSDGDLKTFRQASFAGITPAKTYTVSRMWRRFPLGESELVIVIGHRDGDTDPALKALVLAHDVPANAWRIVMVVPFIDIPAEYDVQSPLERFMNRRMPH